jgi:hypothetical protein
MATINIRAHARAAGGRGMTESTDGMSREA